MACKNRDYDLNCLGATGGEEDVVRRQLVREITGEVLSNSPSGGKNADVRRVAVEVGGAHGGDDGVLGDGGGPEAGEHGGISMAQLDDRPRPPFLDIGYDPVEDAADGRGAGVRENVVGPEPPSPSCDPVLHENGRKS